MYLILLMTALAVSAAETPDAPKAAKECRSHVAQQATHAVNPPPPVQRLDRLPPGNLELAVQRQVDGCIEPTILRYGVDLRPPAGR